jgi:hypothetical protein
LQLSALLNNFKPIFKILKLQIPTGSWLICIKRQRVLKKIPKNSFCFELSEIFTVTDSYVVVVDEKLPFRLKYILKS